MAGLSATLSLDVSKFEEGLSTAQAHLQTFERAGKTMSRDLSRLLEGFSGEKVAVEAARMAEAVRRVGGAANLTEAEQRRVNATVTEAIEKYRALGQQAPAELRRLQADTASAAKETTLLTKAAQGLMAVFSVRAVVNMAKDALQLTGQLADLAAKTGVGTEALQRLSFVTAQSGVSLEQVADGVVKMSRTLVGGDKAAVTAVRALGLQVQDLIALGPEGAFLAIGSAIAKVPNPMEQAALATALFGRSGADYLPAFSVNMQQVAADAQRSGAIIGNDLVQAGDRAGDALGRLSAVGSALSVQVLAPLAPAIEELANWMGTALPAALNASRQAVTWLLERGMRLNVWVLELAASVSQAVRDVPVLGRVFGQSAADVAELQTRAQYARDALNSFLVQGVTPAAAAVATATPLTTGYAEALHETGRAARTAKEAAERVGVVWGDLSNVLRFQLAGVLSPALTTFATQTTNAARAMDELRDAIYRVQGAATTVGPVLRSTMTLPFAQFAPTVQAASTAGQGFFSQLVGGAQGASTSLTNLFTAAFTGGGGALGAVKAFATETVSRLLGMIPGVGPFVQGFAGPIVEMFSRLTARARDFFRTLFGGPSGGELAGRAAVADFEDALAASLTTAQRAEAGNDRWRQTVIAIRDAYLAAGLSEQEALADAERLWASSRQGAEASAAVIAEIDRKMRRTGQAAASVGEGVEDGLTTASAAAVLAIDKIGDAMRTLPDVVDFEVRGRYRGPDDLPDDPAGYASGTLGVHGQYFRNFGSGTPAVLHGAEAVVRKDQAVDFAQAVLGARVQPAARPSSGGRTTIRVPVYIDGRQVATATAPYLPGALRTYGV